MPALESEFRAELNIARQIALHAAREAKPRVARVEVEVNDVWVVERVQRLDAELQSLALAQVHAVVDTCEPQDTLGEHAGPGRSRTSKAAGPHQQGV